MSLFAEHSSIAIHVDQALTGTDLCCWWSGSAFFFLCLILHCKNKQHAILLQPPHKQGYYCFNGLLQLTKQPLFPDMSIMITLSHMTLADKYSILAASLSFSFLTGFFLPLLLISESIEGLEHGS